MTRIPGLLSWFFSNLGADILCAASVMVQQVVFIYSCLFLLQYTVHKIVGKETFIWRLARQP
jgi:hypothetical protein